MSGARVQAGHARPIGERGRCPRGTVLHADHSRRVPSLIALATLCLGLAAAHAEAQALPASAEVSASASRSVRRAAARAFDADTHTAWCQATSDDAAGGELVVRFAEPVTVASIAVYGVDDRSALEAVTLTIASDVGTVEAALQATAAEPTDVTPPSGATRRLSFRLPPRPAHTRSLHGRCLSDILIRLEERTWVYGVSNEAIAALPAAISALDDAMRACDQTALARWARFPVDRRDTYPSAERAYLTGPGTLARPGAYRRARDLPCAWAFPRESSDRPRIDEGIAPGVVRVLGGASSIAAVYWELAWTASGWRLVALDTTDFE